MLEMAKNKIKDKRIKTPVEQHDTAAWADIEDLKPESQVHIPREFEVRNAKEWVDTNEK